MWTYDKDTGTLDILIAAAGVRSVDIKPPTMPRRTSDRGSSPPPRPSPAT